MHQLKMSPRAPRAHCNFLVKQQLWKPIYKQPNVVDYWDFSSVLRIIRIMNLKISSLEMRSECSHNHTVYPKKYAHGFCFAVLCCGYTLTDFPISIRLTSLALWQSNDCPSASKATLMNMDKYFMWIHYERLHNHNKAKHNKTVCIFLGKYCIFSPCLQFQNTQD